MLTNAMHTMKPKIFLPGPSRKTAGVISPHIKYLSEEELHLIMPRSQDSEQSTLQKCAQLPGPDEPHTYELDQLTTSEVFIDGTKIEAAKTNILFVWKTGSFKASGKILRKNRFAVEISYSDSTLKPLWQSRSEKACKEALKTSKNPCAEAGP